MKRTFITIIGALCIVVASATMAVASTAAPKSAARSNATGATSASSGFPTVCPPAAVVGKALGLTVSKPTVPMYLKGRALECKYGSGKSQTTISYSSDARKAFLTQETSLPKGSVVVVTNLGKGVAAYLVLPDVLHVQDGTLECVIETEVVTAQSHEEALAKVLLKSYW
ncbi:MAG: hypothetical protein ABSA65_17505 [Acidimicrobiales bacterium]|jgi:hypothetical protein